MRLDKLAYLSLACFTCLVIVLVIAFGSYGTNISKDPNFLMFFKWYIFLFIFNLINILITLIFHYVMADVPGVQGLKGYSGDKGLPGKNDKCFCRSQSGGRIPNTDIDSLDINADIKTRDINNLQEQRVGTVIYHDTDSDPNTPLLVGGESPTAS